MPRTTAAKAAQTRKDILARAIDLASVEGLGGLTIGRVAAAISMSKSGVFAHFGSKEDLQIAVVDAAAEIFVREVLVPAGDLPAGLARLSALTRHWLAYVEKGLFRGGCFFSAVSAEVDDRPGRVRDRVATMTRDWLDRLEADAQRAVDEGALAGDADPAQIAFEVHAFLQEANWAFQLHGDAQAFRHAGRAIRRSLEGAATAKGRAVLAEKEVSA